MVFWEGKRERRPIYTRQLSGGVGAGTIGFRCPLQWAENTRHKRWPLQDQTRFHQHHLFISIFWYLKFRFFFFIIRIYIADIIF